MTADQDWMIDSLARVAGVRHVILCSRDGLVIARSASLDRDDSERLAATCTSLLSVSRSVAGTYGTGGRALYQVMAQYEGGVLFLRGAAEGTCLGVLTQGVIDPALIGQEMQRLVLRYGESVLRTPLRDGAPNTFTSAPAPGAATGGPGA
ncbi:roadblock/LC7 domain-containing protein [Actinomadura logoneensis]|uniref:Roadblock/LC7 domain-containing protein n=1 Tax=Actinomadura logoneensis TaxID=2293572 RepID=A0A372JG19_9ACTN|nr:roadblock/LC7 domain-containing protein [Actinomadura logoneensis]RFU38910.1 roadblock/LC7 domain-containing protein [Actinomadura logoneensis]